MLIAEDNDINAMLARATLIKAGHRVDVVGNGRAAVDAVTGAGQPRYDVVLMDLHMPVMDGLDAIAVIRRHEEEQRPSRRCRSWCCRPTARKRPAITVLAHGASGFVTKPLDPDALVRAVEEQRRRSGLIGTAPGLEPVNLIAGGASYCPIRLVHGTVTILLHCPLIPAPRGMARRRITRANSTARSETIHPERPCAACADRRNVARLMKGTALGRIGSLEVRLARNDGRDRCRAGSALPGIL